MRGYQNGGDLSLAEEVRSVRGLEYWSDGVLGRKDEEGLTARFLLPTGAFASALSNTAARLLSQGATRNFPPQQDPLPVVKGLVGEENF
jgi:hypothetical protein